MALLYEPGTDPSRVYYGTDTRAFALLVGAALAIIWPSRKLSIKTGPQARVVIDGIGAGGLVTIAVMIRLTDQYDSFLYRGGLALLSVAAALAVAVLVHPVSRLGKVLGCKPLRWLGVRSYGIYLWHYPVIVLTSPTVNTGGTNIMRSIFQIVVCIVLAALSWRFIEEPIRSGGLGKVWRRMRPRDMSRGRVPVGRTIASLSMILVMMVAVIGLTSCASGKSAGSVSQGSGNLQTDGTALPRMEQPGTGMDGTAKPNETSKPQSNGSNQHVETPKPDAGRGMIAIGDSVMLDIAPYLKDLLPGITIDGKVGRQMSQAKAIIDKFKSNSELGDVVIIGLGTNGTFSKKTLDTVLQSLEDVQQIVLVNIRVPRPWERDVNSTLANEAIKFDNVTLVDWYAASTDKDSYFAKDGVHLDEEGAKAFASLVADAIKPQ
ncbi:acyltransferase family protein [Cohnella sp. REN36]|uniref:acyltransferase family protein n=1 Tax=Cohnella sp. REN36 TaxID=2887347 RepID=UPI00351D7C9C